MDRLQAMVGLVTVVDAGSFSAAARQLGVGQPALSKLIKQLEERLSVRLLVRSTHGLTTTDAGLRFYERARLAIREVEEAELEARGDGAGLIGRLRVSAATTFARLLILPRLPEFLSRHPSLDIDVILDDRNIDLVSEGIDIALRLGTLADSIAVARKIASSRRSVVATPAYLARAGAIKLPSDLVHHNVVVYSQLGNTWTFRQGDAELSVTVRGRLRVSAAEGIRAAVLADMGLAVASDWMFTPELADGTVQRVLSAWRLPSIDLWAVFPTGRLASAKARAFAEFVQGILNADRESSQA
jgi:DNA-binding transcriptional LysR family regulator